MIIHRKNNLNLFLLTFAVFLLSCEILFAQKTDHVPGDLIVMLKKGSDVNALLNHLSYFDGKKTQLSAAGNLSAPLNIWLLHFDNTLIDENRMLGALQQDDDVKIVQFNHYAALRNTPNDPDFGQQWNMLNIGQSGGTSGADIRAVSAWDLTTGGVTPGGDTIVVAIDDEGFDLSCQDIHFWKNFHEIPGNEIDDDGNGYIDDHDGWNALNNNGIMTSDPLGHGTHVSGIAGAIGNNSVGVTGVNWNVEIMPVQGFSGTESIVVIGYSYIMEMRKLYNETNGAKGAFVVSANSSFGIDQGQPANYPIWCAMYDSMGQYGILNVAATANQNWNIDVLGDIPTACPSDYLISVTNTNESDLKYPQAAYGDTTIDLGAPGTDILSTIPGNSYTTKTGTSSASPHVTGAVALLYSLPCSQFVQDYRTDPAGTALRVKNFILSGVDSIGDLSVNYPTVSGGRLNVYNSLLLMAQYYNCNVGIDEVTSVNQNIVVYPNPASDVLHVVIKNPSAKQQMLSVKNILGQTLIEKNLALSTRNLTLDISALQSGIYFLNLEENNSIETLKWIKE